MNMNILRCWAEIDMDAVCGNFRSIRAFVPKEKKLMAVIKADGYGHGSVPIAEALEGEADFYGVAMLDEAVELRQAGIKTPILILGYTQRLSIAAHARRGRSRLSTLRLQPEWGA